MERGRPRLPRPRAEGGHHRHAGHRHPRPQQRDGVLRHQELPVGDLGTRHRLDARGGHPHPRRAPQLPGADPGQRRQPVGHLVRRHLPDPAARHADARRHGVRDVRRPLRHRHLPGVGRRRGLERRRPRPLVRGGLVPGRGHLAERRRTDGRRAGHLHRRDRQWRPGGPADSGQASAQRARASLGPTQRPGRWLTAGDRLLRPLRRRGPERVGRRLRLGWAGRAPRFVRHGEHPPPRRGRRQAGVRLSAQSRRPGRDWTGSLGGDKVVQRIGPYGGVWSPPAVWPGSGGWVYYPAASGGTTAEGSTGNSTSSRRASMGREARRSPWWRRPDVFGFGSSAPVVTSNGTADGTALVWVVGCRTARGRTRSSGPTTPFLAAEPSRSAGARQSAPRASSTRRASATGGSTWAPGTGTSTDSERRWTSRWAARR